MSKNIYNEYVEVTEELDTTLKKCFINHLVIYNYSLSILYNNPECTFKVMMKIVNRYIEERKIYPILNVALLNELYYQYKKFKRNIRVQKLITDIQYFTFLSTDYRCKSLDVNDERTQLTLEGLEGVVTLPKPLPDVGKYDSVYINISYSNIENRYKLSVYTSQ